MVPSTIGSRWTVAPYLASGKVYRVAVLGGPGSGKTCLLAVLGLTGREDSTNRTCVRLDRLPGLSDADRPDPDTIDAPEEVRRNPVRAFFRADTWLRAAERELSAGRPPEANPATLPPLLAVYTFAHPDRGELTLEVIDFPGELLRASSSERANVAAVRAFFDHLDGLLILAEVPDGEGGCPPFDELLRVFAAWTDGQKSGPRRDLPVAIVFNKWDRRGKLDATPSEREAEVEALLRDSVSHRNVLNAVSPRVAACSAFAASAFGQREGASGSERPAGPPSPYGVEQPFLWVCRESDRLVHARMMEEAKHLQWWKVWRVRTSCRLGRTARDVQARSLPQSSELRDADTIRSLTSRTRGIQTSLLAACMAIGLGTLLWQVHVSLEERQQDAARQEVDNTMAARRSSLTRLATELKAARVKNSEPAVRVVWEEYSRLPPVPSHYETESDRAARLSLETEIQTALVGIIGESEVKKRRVEWGRTQEEIERAIEELNFNRAARLMRTTTVELPEVASFRTQFGARLIERANKSTHEIASREWGTLRKLEETESPLLNADLMAVMRPEERAKLTPVIKHWKREQDRIMYQDFVESDRRRDWRRSRSMAENYRQQAPLKTMLPTIEAYLKWISDRECPRKTCVNVSFDWGKWPKPSRDEVTVHSRRGPSDAAWDVVARLEVDAAEEVSKEEQSVEFVCKPSEPLEILVSVKRTDGFYAFSSRPQGSFTFQKNCAEEFSEPVSEPLGMEKGENLETKVRVRMTNMPSRLSIPPWKEE